MSNRREFLKFAGALPLTAGLYGCSKSACQIPAPAQKLKNDKKLKVEVERCMAIGKDCPGFFMACGNHLPASVPV
jgi:hypothetical protein